MKAHVTLAVALLTFVGAGCTADRATPLAPLDAAQPRHSLTPGETVSLGMETQEWRTFGMSVHYTELYDVTYGGGQVQVLVEQSNGSRQEIGTYPANGNVSITVPATGRLVFVPQPYSGCISKWDSPYEPTGSALYADEHNDGMPYWLVFQCYA